MNKKPPINANLSQSHSVPSHAVPACSWLEQALAPRSVTLGLSPRVPVAIASVPLSVGDQPRAYSLEYARAKVTERYLLSPKGGIRADWRIVPRLRAERTVLSSALSAKEFYFCRITICVADNFSCNLFLLQTIGKNPYLLIHSAMLHESYCIRISRPKYSAKYPAQNPQNPKQDAQNLF